MDTNLVTWRKASYSQANSDCVEVGVWRKASYSTQNSACVEVGTANFSGSDTVCLIRDTKDRSGASLAFTPATWASFTGDVKAGRFGRLTLR